MREDDILPYETGGINPSPSEKIPSPMRSAGKTTPIFYIFLIFLLAFVKKSFIIKVSNKVKGIKPMKHASAFVRILSVLLLIPLLFASFAACVGSGGNGGIIPRETLDPEVTTAFHPVDSSASPEDGSGAMSETPAPDSGTADAPDPETTDTADPETTEAPETDSDHTHQFSDWISTSDFTCLGEKILIRTCQICGTQEESYKMEENTSDIISLDGKKVAFIGNSFIYYGNCVINGGQGSTDTGYFYQLARRNGESVTVYDYVYGGRNLKYIYNNTLKSLSASVLADIDYVFLSEAGENNSAIIQDLTNIMKLFPEKTQFLYLCHSYTYYKGHSNITSAFARMQELGISVVNWGELVYRVSNGSDRVSGVTETYNKETFVKNNSGATNGSGVVGAGSSGDAHHPNPLSGYLTALMAYTAITGRSAVGQPYDFCSDSGIHRFFDLNAFEKAHYNGSKTTNFLKVFASESDMRGLQMLADAYIEKYDAFSGIVNSSGEHRYGETGALLHEGSSNTKGWKTAVCSRCGHIKTTEVSGSNTQRENLFLIPHNRVQSAGYTSVKEYMLAGKSEIVYQTETGWGRLGFASIQGMASMCDGERSASAVNDGSVLYWKIKNRSTRYDADGRSGGKYCSLIGYELKTPIRASGLSLFVLSGGALEAYDILGGKKNSDGSITWTVLASCTGTDAEYIPYDNSTDVFSASFDPAEFDCLEIGVISASSDLIYMSELEIYGDTNP